MSEPQGWSLVGTQALAESESLLLSAELGFECRSVNGHNAEVPAVSSGRHGCGRRKAAAALAAGFAVAAVLVVAACGLAQPSTALRQRANTLEVIQRDEESGANRPCQIIIKDGVGHLADEDSCDDADQMPEECATPGHNCSKSKCCAWGGMQCYEKDTTWASCKWSCQAGPDLTEEMFNKWSCKALGPRTPGKIQPPQIITEVPEWVSEECSEDGEDCSKTRCCVSPGLACFEFQEGNATCMDSCVPGPDFHEEEMRSRTCKVLGPRTPGFAEAVQAPVKFEDLPVWVKNCTGTGTYDCSKTKCCQDPKRQCFEKQEGWATCQEACFPGVDPENEAGGSWSCKSLGPRTPAKCPSCAPMEPGVMDVIIPFFERDLCKLKYTAKSLGVNDPYGYLGKVFLMWISSQERSQYQDEIDEALSLIREGPNGKEAEVVDFKQKMESAWPHPIGGWHAQQLGKLKMASVVNSDYYMVLDSKNTLIRPVTAETFFTECNQAIIQAEFPYDKIPVPHSDWYERSANVLGFAKPNSGVWPASITPVVMHRQTVLDMLQQLGEDPGIDKLCNGPLCEHIGAFSDSGHGATEFTLYTLYAYAKRKEDQLKCIHDIYPMKHFKLDYSESWRKEMVMMLRNEKFPTDWEQVTVSDGNGYPLDWTPAESETRDPPTQDKFPLRFEDLTHKWAASLWRGEESNAGLLVEVNLHTLADTVEGVRQFPVMFGAQPASLSPMEGSPSKDTAVGELIQMYKRANLYDESDDLVGCVVGYKN